MPENAFLGWVAASYDSIWPHLYSPEVLDPCVDFLSDLAGDGAALELGVGTGRVALALAGRGVDVHGIELSEDMVVELQRKPGAEAIGVTVGDFATVSVGRRFRLAYLVRNTITNLTTQQEQVACFENVARHLEPGGFFVIENYVPELRRLVADEAFRVFDMSPSHVGVDEYDVVTQIDISHHFWTLADGRVERFSSRHRYVWPSELDLMARIAGMRLRSRWAGWDRSPFTSESRSHISVWEMPA